LCTDNRKSLRKTFIGLLQKTKKTKPLNLPLCDFCVKLYSGRANKAGDVSLTLFVISVTAHLSKKMPDLIASCCGGITWQQQQSRIENNAFVLCEGFDE